MSLSKVYKESKNFQPEEILPRTDPRDTTWPAPARPKSGFIESPQEKRLGDQVFKQEHLLSPAQKSALPPSAGTTQLSSASPTDVEMADSLSQDIEPGGQKAAKGIDQATVDRMLEEAYQQGIEEGQLRSETDFGSAAAALLELFQQLDRIRETLLKNSFGEMQDLALAVAEKIIRTSVREQDTTLLATVEEAIHSAVKSDEFYIYVNPEDFEKVQEKSAELVAGVNGLNNIIIKKDPEIERGGCRVESDYCIVDASIGSQFDIIREKIKNRLLVV